MFLIVSVIATHTILIREVSSIEDPVNQSKQTKGKLVKGVPINGYLILYRNELVVGSIKIETFHCELKS